MPIEPKDLSGARRAWLEAHRQQHARQNDAQSALALAQAEWACGGYWQALRHFQEACEHAPQQPQGHVSCVRAAASLAEWSVFDEALQRGRALHPEEPLLALAEAQHVLSRGASAALDVLAPLADRDPFCAMYARALQHLVTGEAPGMRSFGDARLDAAWQGFVWCYQQHGPDGFVGFPTQVLLSALTSATVPGSVLECGVYFGRSLRLLAERAGQPVQGFDSFQGLPEAWNENEPAGAYTTAGELPDVPDNVTLHVGWFENSLPPFFAANPTALRLLHIDCDLHSSTRTALDAAAASLRTGTIVVFDDFVGFPGYENHEFSAWHQFAQSNGVRWSVLSSSLLAREVTVRVES